MTQERIDIVVSEKGSKQASQNIAGISKGALTAQNSIVTLNQALGAIGVGLSINSIKNVLDGYTTMQNALKQVTTSQEQLNQVTEELYQMSQRTRSSLNDNAEAYRRFALAGRDLGLTQRDVLQFTESLNQAVKLSGASGAEASAGIIQFSQGLASGALRGDELRSVLEQIPAVADVIANSLGVTRGELRKMGEAGTLTSDKIIKAFQEARVELQEKFAKSTPTIADSFVVVGNSISKYAGELDKAYGISSTVSGILITVANNVDLLAKAIGIATAAWVSYRIAANASVIASITAAVVGNVVAFLQLASTVRSVSQAMALLNAVLLVNPLILLATIVIAAIAALVLFRKEVYEMMKATTIAGVNVADAFTTMIDVIRGTAYGLINLIKILLNDVKIEYFKFVDSLSISQDLKDSLLGSVDIDFSLKGKTAADAFNMGFEKAVANGGSKAMIEKSFAGKPSGPDLLGESLGTKRIVDPNAVKAQEDAIKRQKKLLEDIQGAAYNYKQTMSDLDALLSQGKITTDQYGDSLLKLKEKLLENDKTINGGLMRGMIKLQQEFSNLSTISEQLVTDAFKGMEDALVNFVSTGKLEIGDLVKSISADFARLAIRQTITLPLMKAFGFQQGGLVEGYATGGLIKGSGTGLSDSNLAAVSTGEYIVNAAATSRFRPLLDFINSGGTTVSTSTPNVNTTVGGNSTVFAPIVEVNISGGNNSNGVDAQAQGEAISGAVMKALEGKFSEWLLKQQRPGGGLNSQGAY